MNRTDCLYKENREEMFPEGKDRYSRLRLAGWQPDILKAARVLVAGAGALGNEVLKNLALLGVGNILVVDFDRIEASNLCRSVLFRESDVGSFKAEVAALRARELNSGVSVQWFHNNLVTDLGAGLVRRADLVIGCLDNMEARLAINRFCRMACRPWVDGGLLGLDGQVRLFASDTGPCYECTLNELDYAEMRRRYSCQGVTRSDVAGETIPTTPTSASLMAALQVEFAVKILHGMEVPFGCQFVYSNLTQEILRVHLLEKADCLSHERAEPLVELVWASSETSSLRSLLTEARLQLGPDARLSLDREIATRLVCPACQDHEDQAIAVHRFTEMDLRCPLCQTERTVLSTHQIDDNTKFLDVPVGRLGIPPGHIICARRQGSYCYLELSGDLAHDSDFMSK